MADISIQDPAVHPAPKSYTIAGAQEIILKGVSASFDGSGAASSWVPAVQIVDPSGHVVGTYPCGTALAAGASADVAWFPGVGGQSQATGSTTQAYSPLLDTPDNSGNTFPALTTANGFSHIRRVLPYFAHGGAGSWFGTIRVPSNYVSTPILTVSAVVNSAAGAVRWIVGSAVVANGASEDAAFTNETAQNITVPGVALRRFDTIFPLSTSPVAGADLNFVVTRDGGNAGDTCTATAAVWTVLFTYTSG